MGGILSTPKAPTIPAPQPMPDPNDELLKQRQRQAAATRVQSGSRTANTEFSVQENKPVGR